MSPGIPTRLLATQSDERLLAFVRQGHERAFEALVHRYRKQLLYYCRRLRLSDARAEDIVQLALLKTWIAVREGAEVRDLKAWLYRVVHNTAVNALRDAAHDGDPVADPTQGLGSHSPQPPLDETQLDRGLQMREALAEVAALPPLQREVIVRTAVAGHSHEQVASDLGISNGAVRGLLYRARTTLRTAITALTPPPLLSWLAGRSDQSSPAPERLTELASGGGAAGVGGAASGLLLKGGVVAITAGTVITGAAVVHLGASTHHRDRHRLIAVASPNEPSAGSATAASHSAAGYRELSTATTAATAGAHRGASTRRFAHSGSGVSSRGGTNAHGGGGSGGASTAPSGGAPRSTTHAIGQTHKGAPAITPAAPSPAPNSSQGSGQVGAGSGQSSGSGGEVGAGSGSPVGSAAGTGSGAGSSPGAGPTEGGASGSGSSTESSKSGSEGSSSQGASSESSGSSGSESSGSEHSGSLVGTVVHEVGSILEHLLH